MNDQNTAPSGGQMQLGQDNNSKSSRKSLLRLGILAIVIGLLAWYVSGHWSDFEKVKNLSAQSIISVLAVDVVFYIASAAALIFVLRPFSIKPGKVEAFQLAMMTRFFNIIVPLRGGAFARALYLKKRYDLGPAKFMIGLSGMLLMSIFTSLLWVLGGFIYLWAAGVKFYTMPIAIVSVMLIAIAALAMIKPRIDNPKGKVQKILSQLADGWRQFVRHKSSIVGLAGVYSTIIITQTVMYTILLDILAPTSQINLGYLAVIIALGNISMAFQITPGNMGIYEGVLVGISSIMGLEHNTILMAGLTWRVLDCIFVFVVGGASNLMLSRRLTREF